MYDVAALYFFTDGWLVRICVDIAYFACAAGGMGRSGAYIHADAQTNVYSLDSSQKPLKILVIMHAKTLVML